MRITCDKTLNRVDANTCSNDRHCTAYIEPALRPELLHEQQVGDLELVVPVLRVLQVDEALLQAYLPRSRR